MTPVAQAFMRRFTLPMRKRVPVHDSSNMIGRKLFEDFLCFDLRAVHQIIRDLTQGFDPENTDAGAAERQISALGKLVFLPAPRTWIEHGGNEATYLVQTGEDWATEYAVQHRFEDPRDPTSAGAPDEWLLFQVGRLNLKTGRMCNWDSDYELECACYTHSALAIINSPRVISRLTRPPHRGLHRDLNRLYGGKFPLRAWTEIVLKVKDPGIESATGGYMTGARALHFVRKHIRIRLGQLEYVSAHWRGDPSVGIRQSRYRVVS